MHRVLKNKLPPGPLGNNVPFLGYLPFIDPKKPYETLSTLAQQHGPIYGLQLGSIYCVVLSDASIIRDAFKREEFTGRAPLYVTHGIMDNCGKLKVINLSSHLHNLLLNESQIYLSVEFFGN